MRRFTSALCLTAGMLWAVGAAAQYPQGQTGKPQGASPADKTVTVIGCLEPGTANSFVLNVVDESAGKGPRPESGQPTGTTGMAAAGQRLELVVGGRADIRAHVGHKVEITGMMVPQGVARGRETGQPAALMRFNVRGIKHLADTCTAGTSGTVPPASTVQPPTTAPPTPPAATTMPPAATAPPPAPPATTPTTPAPQAPTTATPAPTTPPAATPTPAAPSATPPSTTTPTPTSPTIAPPSSTQATTQTSTAVTGPTMLSGLLNLNVQDVLANLSVSANVQNIAVNVSNVLNDVQVSALIQALSTNPTAKATADKLTSALREKGVLQSTERVVGYSNGVIYKASTTPQ
jgi:hypothetical protein